LQEKSLRLLLRNLILSFNLLYRASAFKKQKTFSFLKDLNILMKNKNYILLIISFTFLYGIYASLGAAVSFITRPYGYTSKNNSLFASVMIVFGVLGSIGFSIILDKFKKYKLILLVLCFGGVASLATSLYTLPSENVPLFCLSLAF
jgi:Na+/melibiose symporter-like transporter